MYIFGYNLNGLNFGVFKGFVNQFEFTPAGKIIISEFFSTSINIYHPTSFKIVRNLFYF